MSYSRKDAMNRQIAKLLSLILVCSAALNADNDTKMTFLSMGGQRNVAERNMLTQRIAMRKNQGIGGTLQATPFFKRSYEGSRFAEALSPVGKALTTYGSADNVTDAATNGAVDVNFDPIDGLGTAGVFTLKTDPKHQEFGVHFAWQQRLDVLFEGLFFELDVPVVNVKHELNPVYAGVDAAAAKTDLEGTTVGGAPKYLKYYTGSLSKTGVADVALRLGYSFLEEEDYRLAVNVAAVAPTGGKPTSVNLFAPQIGDNNHWAIGAGVTLSGCLYENNDHELRGLAELNYRYRFANTQQRTVGLKNVPTFTRTRLYDATPDAYFLVDKTTIDLKVTGGSAVNFLAGLGYDYKCFSLDLAYELNGLASEKVEEAANSGFVENAAIKFGYDTGSPAYATAVQLTKANLDFDVATNPSKLTHKVAGSLGYTLWHDQQYPVALGWGGSYTFGSNRTAFKGLGLFGKVGVSF